MIIFKNILEYPAGTLCNLLEDAYAFDPDCARHWRKDWQEFDDFFYDHLRIADTCGFITVLNDAPIGFVSWNPTGLPEHVEIGHNCIATAHKGRGYGVLQMQEALHRIMKQHSPPKIIVTTNELLLPAQHMYARVGFRVYQRRPNDGPDAFAGNYIDCVFPES